MKHLILISTFACFISCTNRESAHPDYPIQQVKSNQVTLIDCFRLPKIRTIPEKTIRYAFEKCKAEVPYEHFGNIFSVTSFGESHGAAIGGVIDGYRPSHADYAY